MELRDIEFAAKIVYAMCQNHPELCPHSHEWHWSSAPNYDGMREAHYKCRICGHEEVRMERN